MIHLAQAFGINHEALEDLYPRLFEQPFDSQRKRMTTVHKIDGEILAYSKGAVDEMLPLCSRILTAQGVRPITAADRQHILSLCQTMSAQALRVLGFAMRSLQTVPEDDEENVEYDLTFLGACLLYTSQW